MSSYKCGFVTVIGRPNVGKSTLINYIIGQKISIVSDKPQTTRNDIKCIYTTKNAQIIFVDTPGIHVPKHKLGEYMVEVAKRSIEEVDVVVYMVDVNDRQLSEDDKRIVNILSDVSVPIFLVVNKVDTLRKKQAFWLAVEVYTPYIKPAEIIPISALKGINVDVLIDKIIEYLPESPPLYPEDQLTDKNLRFIAAEIIREKVLHLTHQEVPHSVAVVIEEFKEREKSNSYYISATIYVEREGQKAIIIGEKGKMIKKIGQLAREELELLLNGKVYLELWVKVRQNWRRSENEIRRLGYKV